jgi:hypothetical protein
MYEYIQKTQYELSSKNKHYTIQYEMMTFTELVRYRKIAGVKPYFNCKERGVELSVRRLSDFKKMMKIVQMEGFIAKNLGLQEKIASVNGVTVILKKRRDKWQKRLLMQTTLSPTAPMWSKLSNESIAWDPMRRPPLCRYRKVIIR